MTILCLCFLVYYVFMYVCTVCMTKAYLQLLTRSHERDSLNVSLLVFLSGAKLSTYVLEMRLMTVCKDA